jgi:pyridinium-3,5-bisthiocarboxylic acid mononucleotide nickel chelatase
MLMKMGRPAHTLSVLAPVHLAAALRGVVFAQTSTIGLREVRVDRHVLARSWVVVSLPGGTVRVKVAVEAGCVVHATPEFDDVAALAARHACPVRDVLEAAVAAAVAAGLVPGAPAPGGELAPGRERRA